MRFDHAVIGVRDLDRATEAYRGLGFVVRPGGRHTGEGTHNAIVRFGLDYLELMAVHDAALARTRPFGSQLLDALEDREGGLIGYVVAGRDADALADTMRRAGLEPVGPLAMERERPDGRVLAWRLLFPRGPRWRDIAPFVVEWGTSDADRVAWDAPAPHPNGTSGVAALTVAVDDLALASALYRDALGIPVSGIAPDVARAALGDVAVELVAPPACADGARALATRETGLVELTLRVADASRAGRAMPGLTRHADGIRHVVPPASALGARLLLTEVSAPER